MRCNPTGSLHATGARRQEGQKRRYKDLLKKLLKQLQINPVTWNDLAQDRSVRSRSVKTGSAIYEANKLPAAKAKRAALKSPAPRTNTANSQALPTCQRYQSIFRARIGLIGHLRTQCTNNFNFYVKFCQPFFRPPPRHSWHQFHYSHFRSPELVVRMPR
ncbi:unnamed protein product [Schistocephalus solidus]|uniref:Uncharacterized protein n=1 Tax=Schistocephalus solidus TaxID=70667 RepID=A0A183TNW7_SCHSO|nr:unnamed protein product [Schistocephalus solidus]